MEREACQGTCCVDRWDEGSGDGVGRQMEGQAAAATGGDEALGESRREQQLRAVVSQKCLVGKKATTLLIFILLAILGWAQFGPAVHR